MIPLLGLFLLIAWNNRTMARNYVTSPTFLVSGMEHVNISAHIELLVNPDGYPIQSLVIVSTVWKHGMEPCLLDHAFAPVNQELPIVDRSHAFRLGDQVCSSRSQLRVNFVQHSPDIRDALAIRQGFFDFWSQCQEFFLRRTVDFLGSLKSM